MSKCGAIPPALAYTKFWLITGPADSSTRITSATYGRRLRHIRLGVAPHSDGIPFDA